MVVSITLSRLIAKVSFCSFNKDLFLGTKDMIRRRVSHWACALDSGVVCGGTLRVYEEDRGILEINAKRDYEFDEEKRPSSASVAV